MLPKYFTTAAATNCYHTNTKIPQHSLDVSLCRFVRISLNSIQFAFILSKLLNYVIVRSYHGISRLLQAFALFTSHGTHSDMIKPRPDLAKFEIHIYIEI